MLQESPEKGARKLCPIIPGFRLRGETLSAKKLPLGAKFLTHLVLGEKTLSAKKTVIVGNVFKLISF